MTPVVISIDSSVHYFKAIDVASSEINEELDTPKSEAEKSLIKEENEKENQVTQPTDDFHVTDKANQVG